MVGDYRMLAPHIQEKMHNAIKKILSRLEKQKLEVTSRYVTRAHVPGRRTNTFLLCSVHPRIEQHGEAKRNKKIASVK